MTKIFKRLWTYQVSIAIALILMLTELAVELVQPLIMAKIIDDGLAQEHTETVILWGSILVGISLLAFAAGIINTFYSAHVSQNFGYSLRKELYSIIQYFTFANSSKFASSSLITRLTNDITQLQNMIFMGLRFLLRSPLLIIGGIIMSFVVNARLALLLAVTIPVIILMFIWVIRKGGRMFKKVQGKLDFVNNVMLENLTAVKLIKAYVRKRFETDRFIFASNDLRRNTEKALRLMEITVPLLLFIMNLCIIAILWLGSGQIAAGQTQVGDVVAIINYSLRITSSLSVITMLIMVVSRCKASADRLQEVFEMEEKDSNGHENASKQLEINGKLEFKDVAFVYPNTEYNVLAGISFTVQPNEVIAVMGITGAGKTTLFQLIPRLYEPTKGAVYIDGTDIREYNLDSIRKQIGYVPQVSLLFTGTIKENIRWGNPFATDNEIVKAAKDAQIHDTIMKLPMKYDTRIGQKGINLSGGQRQRLSIARALVRKPKILLLDDSTSALDLQTEKELLRAISTYNATALLITQKISTARKANRILLMEEGKILAYAHHDQLLKENKLYQKIVESQLGKEEASHV
ncbi:ABC transporter ATP-binding protein [Niallia taxi]|uniref:ABC transporter ATP-binding protein n=1 Tax=Niallia taxi TaxID=2499688 RepID=UPI00254F97CF|nr:ABC transporter ATP-binding protein [Niallia taxi]MDK8641393.1 ABC transporter ATP-binding protein [Niallia taxi]MED4039469.1 ABC transporter ATP-binding protein [Niallia taxi]MED4055717.1 ABC transporter ATP-binding protein [Niallia taxi]MED4121379.1 ABC transporter ATP-binding protein [Niallia taxi]